MKQIVLPYASTGYFSKAVSDYLREADEIKPFYEYSPKLPSFSNVIKKRSDFFTDRELLYEALLKQHEMFKDEKSLKSVFQNIESLKDGNTFTVTTAHQPNLFLGPLYLIYKIIGVINLAKKLRNHFTSHHFVPVYWMGSEDHDKDELNHIHLFGKKYSWDTDQEGAFGRMKTASLNNLITEIGSILGNSEDGKACTNLLIQSYLEEETIAAATRKLLYHFFATDGLVVLDGDDASLKSLLVPVMEKDLFHQSSFPEVNTSNTYFSKHYASLITPREINLFYLDSEIRQRIIKDNGRWQVLHTPISFSEDELRELLHSHPEKFSPNVVLRPIYQELVLPNVAFIGGGAEVTYWMQLRSLFEIYNIPFPLILLRNSVLWIDQGNAQKMKKLNISVEEMFKPPDLLIKMFVQSKVGELVSLKEEKLKLGNLMEHTMNKGLQIDGSLKGAIEAEKIKMQKSLEMIEDKLRKSAAKKEETSIQQIHSLKEKFFPQNSLQERHDNFLSFYLRAGDGFFSKLKSNLDPLYQQFSILIDEA
jgi:bacillithiol biosynthesis cysteine-adding enzyme BshC